MTDPARLRTDPQSGGDLVSVYLRLLTARRIEESSTVIHYFEQIYQDGENSCPLIHAQGSSVGRVKCSDCDFSVKAEPVRGLQRLWLPCGFLACPSAPFGVWVSGLSWSFAEIALWSVRRFPTQGSGRKKWRFGSAALWLDLVGDAADRLA